MLNGFPPLQYNIILFMDLLQNIRKLKEIRKENSSQANSIETGARHQISADQNISVQSNQLPKQERIDATTLSAPAPTQLSNLEEAEGERQKVGCEDRNQLPPTKHSASMKKQKQTSIQQKELSLFRGLTFCYPIYNVELTRARGKAIRITIQRYQGRVYEMEELEELIEEMGQQDEQPIFCVDFMLVDGKIPREAVEACIPKAIKYRDIVDFNFVFQCIAQRKILNYSQFLVPEKSKELENYMKAKQAEKLQEIENRHRQRLAFKYAAGIEPIQSAVEDSKTLKKSQQPKQANSIMDQNEKSGFKQVKRPSFNKHIYQSFEKLSQLFEKSDRGRSLSYSRTATVLKSVKFDICCEQDADKLKGMRFIGPKTIEKIKQFIQNGSIEKLTVMEGKEENLVSQKLQKVWGIGKIKAQELYNKGIKSVEDLKELAEREPGTLTKNQKIGLKYYQDLNQRIPRQKVSRMFEYIKKVLFRIVGTEADHNMQVCGSYRRGKQTCGDMDVIITRRDGTFETRLVNNLVDELTNQGFLTDHLAMPRHENPKSCISYMGICKYEDETHHRVDLKYYPVDQFAYAILYFTGSDVFNRNMRLYAMKNGYCLSDHGMWKAEKIGTNIVTHEAGIPCYTEEEIFEKLGIKYKSPQERNL